MNLQNLNPNNLSIPNNCFFGLSTSVADAKVVFLSVPWDATTSYREGTAHGPQAIMDASYQLEWYDFNLPDAWQIGYATLPINSEIRTQSKNTRAMAKNVIKYLEAGRNINDEAISQELKSVNDAGVALNEWVYNESKTLLNQDKLIALIGGDHSVPLGYIKALTEKHQDYSILHIDAHADLRKAYEGFTYSHASIMNNVIKLPNISRLVQVGIRDLCHEEMELIKSDDRLILFDDWQLKNNTYEGMTWATQCEKIISNLSDQVYISFDIDGLNPAFCPNTGTPVPGGLEFNQAIYLIETLVKTGRKIIGLDICEVAPGNSDEWDGNIGARLLYKLTNLMYLSQD